MDKAHEIGQMIADAVINGSVVSDKALKPLLEQPADFRAQLAEAIRNPVGDDNYNYRVWSELGRIADVVFRKPKPDPENFPPKLETMPELDGLDAEDLRELHETVTQVIEDLHERWSALSQLADPVQDPAMLALFAQLDELEHKRLPDIERHLSRRAMERAA